MGNSGLSRNIVSNNEDTAVTCTHSLTKVTDSRTVAGGYIKRRRECLKCGERFSTLEIPVVQQRRNETMIRTLRREMTIDALRKLANSLELGN